MAATQQHDQGPLGAGGRRDAARLTSIASAADAPTVEILRTLELPTAATVIDIGCGTGSLVNSIAREIVPDGLVIALDQDISPARDAGPHQRNTELVQADLRTFVPESPIDLVHARFVLAHLPDRKEVLGRIARTWLAPRGRIVVTEPTALPIGQEATDGVRAVFAAYHQWVREQGMSLDFATEAPAILSQIGASSVTVHARTSRFGGGPTRDRWLALITPVADHLKEYGIDSTVMDEFAKASAGIQTYVIPQIIMTTCAEWSLP